MSGFPQVFDEAHAVKCELAAEVLRTSGSLRLRVTGWSMLPAILPGDTLLIERVGGSAVAEGDIVLFVREGRLFAHRVVGTGQQVHTRGDAMPQTDPPVAKTDVLGRIQRIDRNGKIIKPRKSPRLSERAVAALVQRSDMAARIVVGVHGISNTLQQQT